MMTVFYGKKLSSGFAGKDVCLSTKKFLNLIPPEQIIKDTTILGITSLLTQKLL